MTAITIWVLQAFLPAGPGRPPVMVVERFVTQQECERTRAVFPPALTTFACMPSRQVSARAYQEPHQ